MSEGSLHTVTELLAPIGAERIAPRVHAELGTAAADVLRADPWRLLAVSTLRPEQADQLAQCQLGPAARPDDPRRARAIAAWLLARAARDGHTLLAATTVRATLAGYRLTDPRAAVTTAVAGDQTTAVVEVETVDRRGRRHPALALARYATAEQDAADAVRRLRAGPAGGPAADVPPALISAGLDVLTASASQTEAAVAALQQCATQRGGQIDVRHCASTGALTAQPGGRPAGDGARERVVTAAQLLDVTGFAALADAVPDGGRLVLLGDPAELTSAGAGQVLVDLIGSGAVPVTNHPDSTGALATVAAAVRSGVLPPVDPADREVVVGPAGSGAEALHRTLQLVCDSIPRAVGVPGGQVQVITPARRGACGTVALNAALKARLNPGPGRCAGFDPGDPVVVTSTGGGPLVSGERGTVVEADPEGLRLRLGEREVAVSEAQAGVLAHAWAVTVHQARPTRWEAVVAVLPGESAGMLDRALVYTAVTRARRHLSVVHAAGPALAGAVALVPRRRRSTRLADLLRRAGQCG